MITFFPIIPKTGLALSNEAGEEAPHMIVREAFSAPLTPAFFSVEPHQMSWVEIRSCQMQMRSGWCNNDDDDEDTSKTHLH
jgi:hypothetical protein